MTYQEIKNFINTYIVANGLGAITGARLNTALNELADYKGFDSVVVTTLPAGSDATATVQEMTLVLGIPRGADGQDGQNAINPFKGWFNSLDDLKGLFTASAGDSAYVKDASPATTWSIYVYDSTASSDNYWADSGTKADTSNVQTFASGEEVNQTYIDDTNLENPTVNSISKAIDVAPLKYSLTGFNNDVIVVQNPSDNYNNGYYVHGTNGSLASNTGAKYFEIQIPEGTKKIRFLGWAQTLASIYPGAAIGHEVNGVFEKDYAVRFSAQSVSKYPKEYTINLENYPSAHIFRTTIKFNASTPSVSIEDSFYCIFVKEGDTVLDKIDEAEQNAKNYTDEQLSDVNDSIEQIEESLTYEEDTAITPYEQPTTGMFLNGVVGSNVSNSCTSNQYMQIQKYTVEEGKSYKVDCFIGYAYAFYCVYLINSSGVILGRYLTKNESDPSTTWKNEPIELIDGTAEIWLNVQTIQVSKYGVKSCTSSLVDVSSLKSQVDTNTDDIQGLMSANTKLMKVTVDTSQNIMVRSHLNAEKDIAVTMARYNVGGKTNNITFNKVCLGNRDSEDSTLLANEVNSFTDSTPPLNTSKFGYMYAQHGWAIPAFTVSSGSVSNSDVNTEWVDMAHDNRSYYIGKVSGSIVYLIPKITGSAGQQTPSLNFWDTTQPKPTTLTKATDNSRQITGTSSRYDLPVQVIKATHYIADGLEVFVDATAGVSTFHCDTFSVCQDIECKAPWSIATPSDWFEDTIPFPSNSNVFLMQRSYNFVGTSCTVNVSINCESPIMINDYYSVQPQQPFQNGDYNSKTYFPKSKRDGGINSNTTDTTSVVIYRNTTNLYDVNDMTDRVVTVLEDSGDYLIGVASGMSLDKGMTIPSIRNTQTVVGSAGQAPKSYVLIWNVSGAPNKCYFRPFRASGEGTGWDSGIVNTDFVKDFVTYFAWFDPNANPEQQVYCVKEGDYWIVYVHAQTLTGKAAVNLPSNMEGMQVVETIEHTDGATLLTDVVTSGRLYVKYAANSNGQANFITMKLK